MILILAFGNDLREDDGAGLILAERLEQVWRSQGYAVRRIATQQLTPELALEVVQPEIDVVVFVDTRVVAGPSSGAAVEVRALATARPASPVVGHHLDPTVIGAYASLLTDKPLPPFWLVTVPGTAFGHGQGISCGARAAIERALADEHGALAAVASLAALGSVRR